MTGKRPPSDAHAPAALEDADLDIAAGGDGAPDSIWLDLGAPITTQPTSATLQAGKYVLWDHDFKKPGSD